MKPGWTSARYIATAGAPVYISDLRAVILADSRAEHLVRASGAKLHEAKSFLSHECLKRAKICPSR